ncbi:hypothetical protein BpHYR1_006447 [Brachionus plicatilis]|uniref:Uncharacterized protein n=1 Tax=Brachionus plicatilis TaxID=10195 RepID=A0A3M7Q1S4_BRAPC|nr:hypothetical protein BpHYR1_006447 [Brachionus plicatilis]
MNFNWKINSIKQNSRQVPRTSKNNQSESESEFEVNFFLNLFDMKKSIEKSKSSHLKSVKLLKFPNLHYPRDYVVSTYYNN